MSKNNNKPENLHENHRARVRETFKRAGADGMPDHNLLELLLFYSIPRKDTNEIAHRLIAAFGSLGRVFDASYEELMEIDGIGESSALLISMIPSICRRYIESSNSPKVNLSEPEETMNYIIRKYYGSNKVESFYMLCLDAVGNLINCCKLGEGTPGSVIVDKRKVLETALRNKADKVIFAHNHPNGIAAPSKDDINMTSELSSVLFSVGIRLADHIIVAGNEAVSLASVEKFRPLFM
ncbi:MAG: DNA repair protein RadC [Oscillospiraceae bacterium]|nr:DNA repair protein RadC [Oscillospiraceae bacterium]